MIKTNDIKTKDGYITPKSKVDQNIVSAQMKNAYQKTKDTAENKSNDNTASDTPEEYATDRVTDSAETVTIKATDKTVDTTKKTVRKVKKYRRRRKEMKRERENLRDKVHGNHTRTNKPATTEKPVNSSIKTVEQPPKTIRQAPKKTIKTSSRTAKGSVKTAQKTAKTTEKTAKAAIKTSKEVAKAAQKTAQASAKAAKAAAQAAKAAAKAAVAATKVIAKAVVAAVKAIAAGIKALAAAIAAGGWVAVLIIVIICLIAMIIGCCFGIFMSNNDNGTGITMSGIVSEINDSYQEKIESIKSNTQYDVLEMSGSRAVWKDVLAFYAVKTSTGDEAQEVVTITEDKKKLLISVFWEMNSISSRTESKTEIVIETTVDANGNIIETPKEVTRSYLYITVSHLTAQEMAVKYGFNADQNEQLAELLEPEHDDMWTSTLYGIEYGNSDIIAVAVTQLGNIGGQPYWSFSSRVEWCCCFVSWCANECGYMKSGTIPKFAVCDSQGITWFVDRGLWQSGSYVPEAGDIIFFDWDSSGDADHVGIVQKVDDGRVYVIEGNSSDTVARNSYYVGSASIFGYGTPQY